MILAAHLSPAISIPVILLCTCIILWYWNRLGNKDFTASTRRIRRTSIVVMMIALISLAYAMSFADEVTDPHWYTTAWVLSITMLLAIVFLAFLDVLNNMHLHRKDHQFMITETRSRIIEAAKSTHNLHPAEEEDDAAANNKEVTS